MQSYLTDGLCDFWCFIAMLSIKYLGIKLFTMSGSIVCWWAMIIFVIVKLFNVHCCKCWSCLCFAPSQHCSEFINNFCIYCLWLDEQWLAYCLNELFDEFVISCQGNVHSPLDLLIHNEHYWTGYLLLSVL